MFRSVLAALLMVAMYASAQDMSNPSSSSAKPVVQPPKAQKIHTEKTLNGKTLVDDYAWMRERSNPEVKAFLEAENAYAEYVMQPTEARQKKLYDEIVSHIKETDDSVPFLQDGYYYYTRTLKGKQYFELCRKKGSLEAPEQVILDLNKMAEGEKFMSVGAWAVSDDGNWMAYSTDNVGFRQYKLAHPRFAHDDGPARHGGTSGVGGVGGRQQDAVLYGGRPGAEAELPTLSARGGQRGEAGCAGVRGKGRALQHRGKQDAQQSVPAADRRQSYLERSAVPGGGPADRRTGS